MFSGIFEKGGHFEEFPLHGFEHVFEDSKLVWLDFTSVDAADFESIKKAVPLHPLTIENILQDNTRAKINDFGDYLFLVFHAVEYSDGKITSFEIDFVLGKNFLLTFHQKHVKNLEPVKEDILKTPAMFLKGADFLLYYVLDSIVSTQFGVIDSVSDAVDDLENEVFSGALAPKTLGKLFRLKRNVLVFRKIVSPQREVANFLYHHESGFIKPERLIYFRDLYDSLVRITEFIDTTRDMISDAFDAYLSVVSNRLNEIMKVLTIISTIILPMALVTGFYGMNVEFAEYSLFGKEGTYYFALFLMFFIFVALLYGFRRQKWI